MEILKCNADYGKVYYVEIRGSLHQCRLIRTESTTLYPVYVLDVAKIGETRISAKRGKHFDMWYHRSIIPSVLYESVENYRKGKPIIDSYGSTDNCYNAGFISGLFKHCSTCNCGGSIYTWRWDGCKAVRNIVSPKVAWTFDGGGFHCSLNDMSNCYRTKEECEADNEINCVSF